MGIAVGSTTRISSATARVLVIIVCSATSLAFSGAFLIHNASALSNHAPISISSNADFTASNGVTAGSGTGSDPYVIEGWSIYSLYSSSITVSGTTAHFILRNIQTSSTIDFNRVANFALDGVDSPQLNFQDYIVNGSMNRVTAPRAYIQGMNYRGTYIPGPTNLTIQNSAFGMLFVHESDKINIIANTLSNSTYNGLDMIDCGNIAIVGNTVSSNAENGMFVSCSNVLISNNTITGNAKIGILMNGTNYTLSGNHFSHNGISKLNTPKTYRAAGLYVDGVNPLKLTNNLFDSDGLILTPNIMATAQLSGNLANGNPILVYHDCHDISIDNIPVGQLMMDNCNRVRVADLHILDTADAFQAYNLTNATISNNQFSSNNMDGILISGARNVTVIGNTLLANRGDAIDIEAASLITLQHNTIEDSGDRITYEHGSGIVLNANNATLTNNVVLDNQKGGLDITGNNLTISFNELDGNGNQSSYAYNVRGGLTVSGQQLWISNNNASRNFPYGVGVFNSANVNVTENLMIANYGVGILLDSSFPASAFHNNLINNEFNVAEYWEFPPYKSYTASWSLLYPSGGNYYSDYNGTDSCHGPDQDQCSSPDGIGDTPYRFGGTRSPYSLSTLISGSFFNNTDRYPLMKPYGLKPDTDPPTWPSGSLQVTVNSASSVTLTWTPADDQLGVIHYAVYQDGSRIAVVPGTVRSYTVNGLVYGIPYWFHVEAVDPWGNWSTNGPSIITSSAPWWFYLAAILGIVGAVSASIFAYRKGWLQRMRLGLKNPFRHFHKSNLA